MPVSVPARRARRPASRRSHEAVGDLRQREPWERAALELLREGDVLYAVNAHDATGRLHLTDDAPAARAAIVTDYSSAVPASRR
jgi:hypothetical protein